MEDRTHFVKRGNVIILDRSYHVGAYPKFHKLVCGLDCKASLIGVVSFGLGVITPNPVTSIFVYEYTYVLEPKFYYWNNMNRFKWPKKKLEIIGWIKYHRKNMLYLLLKWYCEIRTYMYLTNVKIDNSQRLEINWEILSSNTYYIARGTHNNIVTLK